MRSLLLLFFLIYAMQYVKADTVCHYDFSNQKVEIPQEIGEYKAQYKEKGNKIVVYVKDLANPSEIEDYLVKETLDGKYRMTYSLNCGASI